MSWREDILDAQQEQNGEKVLKPFLPLIIMESVRSQADTMDSLMVMLYVQYFLKSIGHRVKSMHWIRFCWQQKLLYN